MQIFSSKPNSNIISKRYRNPLLMKYPVCAFSRDTSQKMLYNIFGRSTFTLRPTGLELQGPKPLWKSCYFNSTFKLCLSHHPPSVSYPFSQPPLIYLQNPGGGAPPPWPPPWLRIWPGIFRGELVFLKIFSTTFSTPPPSLQSWGNSGNWLTGTGLVTPGIKGLVSMRKLRIVCLPSFLFALRWIIYQLICIYCIDLIYLI